MLPRTAKNRKRRREKRPVFTLYSRHFQEAFEDDATDTEPMLERQRRSH